MKVLRSQEVCHALQLQPPAPSLHVSNQGFQRCVQTPVSKASLQKINTSHINQLSVNTDLSSLCAEVDPGLWLSWKSQFCRGFSYGQNLQNNSKWYKREHTVSFFIWCQLKTNWWKTWRKVDYIMKTFQELDYRKDFKAHINCSREAWWFCSVGSESGLAQRENRECGLLNEVIFTGENCTGWVGLC